MLDTIRPSQRRTSHAATCSVALCILLILIGSAQAQMSGKWVKRAAFPEPSEELVGASVGAKFYVFGGLGPAVSRRLSFLSAKGTHYGRSDEISDATVH